MSTSMLTANINKYLSLNTKLPDVAYGNSSIDTKDNTVVVGAYDIISKISLTTGDIKFELSNMLTSVEDLKGFHQILSVAVDPINQDIYVLDLGTSDYSSAHLPEGGGMSVSMAPESDRGSRIKIYSKTGEAVKVLGRYSLKTDVTSGDGFNFGCWPSGTEDVPSVAYGIDFLKDGSLIVAHLNGVVKVFNPDKTLAKTWTITTDSLDKSARIEAMRVDKNKDVIYTFDSANSRVSLYDKQGNYIKRFTWADAGKPVEVISGSIIITNMQAGQLVSVPPSDSSDNVAIDLKGDNITNIRRLCGDLSGNLYAIDLKNKKMMCAVLSDQALDGILVYPTNYEFKSKVAMSINLRTMVKYSVQYPNGTWGTAPQAVVDSLVFKDTNGASINDIVDLDPTGPTGAAAFVFDYSSQYMNVSSLRAQVSVISTDAKPDHLSITPDTVTIAKGASYDLKAVQGKLIYSDNSYLPAGSMSFSIKSGGTLVGTVATPSGDAPQEIWCSILKDSVEFKTSLTITASGEVYDPTKVKPEQLYYKKDSRYIAVDELSVKVNASTDLTLIDVWAKMSDGTYKKVTPSWSCDKGMIAGAFYKAPGNAVKDKLTTSYTENATTVQAITNVYVHAENYRLTGLSLSKGEDRCEIASVYNLSGISATAIYSDGVDEPNVKVTWSLSSTNEAIPYEYNTPDEASNIDLSASYTALGTSVSAGFRLVVFTTTIPKRLKVVSGLYIKVGSTINLKEKADPEVMYTDGKAKKVDVAWSTKIGSLSGNNFTAPDKPCEVEIKAAYTESGVQLGDSVVLLVVSNLDLTHPIIHSVYPSFAPAGAEIFVIGLNMDKVTTLEIGNVPLVINHIDGTKLSFIVPNVPIHGNLLAGFEEDGIDKWSNFVRFTKTYVWSDNPIIKDETNIKGLHYDELRNSTTEKIKVAKDLKVKYKHSTPLSGNQITARDTYELRYAVNRFCAIKMVWNDTDLTDVKVKKVHMNELRYAISKLNLAMEPETLDTDIVDKIKSLNSVYEDIVTNYSSNPTYTLWQSSLIEGYPFH